jgi:hypothetical protein
LKLPKTFLLSSLAIVSSFILFSSPANAGCERQPKEAQINSKYNNLVSFSPGQYNALQAIPIAVDTYFIGGTISSEWAKEELKRIGMNAAEFLIRNNFNPARDELIGDIMTFQCYERPFLPVSDKKVYGPNIFVPYIAIRRSSNVAGAFMIVSDRDSSLAINAIDGARHNGPIALHRECRNDNPDCLWIYENGMLISARDRSLAVNALNGARHLGDLVLRSDCNASNPDCTWTYRNGMFISDRDPSLAINAIDGARHGVHLKLHNACDATNPDCTWTKK